MQSQLNVACLTLRVSISPCSNEPRPSVLHEVSLAPAGGETGSWDCGSSVTGSSERIFS